MLTDEQFRVNFVTGGIFIAANAFDIITEEYPDIRSGAIRFEVSIDAKAEKFAGEQEFINSKVLRSIQRGLNAARKAFANELKETRE